MPDQIFISYRRDDAAYVTGHINDRLRKEFGDEAVFTDVDNLAFGVDFRKVLDDTISKCQIVLAVIGEDWLTIKNQEGQCRLQDPADFVRIEIESALQRNIPVIPLLISGTKMPTEEELPDSIQELAYRNATQIRPAPDFHTDMDRLIKNLRAHLQTVPTDGDEQGTHSESWVRRSDELDEERLLAEIKLHRATGENRSESADIAVRLDEEEKTRRQIELGINRPTTNRWWTVPLWVVGLLLVGGASWFFVGQYQDQVQATNAALEVIEKAAADAEAKRQADAIAEAKRQAVADAEAKRQAEAKRLVDTDTEINLQAAAIAAAILQADADAEAKRLADVDAETKRLADADAETKRLADADEETKRQADADAQAKRQARTDAVAKRKIDASAFMREGVALAGVEDHSAAIQNYDEAIRLNPETAFVYKQRGASYHALGDYEAAVKDYDESIRLNAGDANAYYSRSASHYALLDYEAAIEDCDEAIRLNPEFANAYLSRGASHRALGNLEAAEYDVSVAADINSGRNDPR